MGTFDTTKAAGGEANPVDQTVRDLIQDVRDNQGGFVLSLAREELPDGGGKKLLVEVGHKAEQFTMPREDRQHVLADVPSIIAYATQYGTKEKSIIFVNDAGIALVLDDSVEKGNREVIKSEFAYSQAWEVWKALLNGQYLNHRKMLETLIAWSHTLLEPAILQSMRSAPVNATVKSQSEIARDAKTVGYYINTAAGEDLLKFPENFKIQLPIFRMDEGDDRALWPILGVTLLIDLPLDPAKEQVKFGLRSADVYAAWRKRVAKEIEALRAGLPEWMILSGAAGYKAANIFVNPQEFQP